MAVDTRAKRQSAQGFGILALAVGLVPDGTIGAADRIHATGWYAGITVSAAAAVAASKNELFMNAHGRALKMDADCRDLAMNAHGRALKLDDV